jgi:hypothetical protein
MELDPDPGKRKDDRIPADRNADSRCPIYQSDHWEDVSEVQVHQPSARARESAFGDSCGECRKAIFAIELTSDHCSVLLESEGSIDKFISECEVAAPDRRMLARTFI